MVGEESLDVGLWLGTVSFCFGIRLLEAVLLCLKITGLRTRLLGGFIRRFLGYLYSTY